MDDHTLRSYLDTLSDRIQTLKARAAVRDSKGDYAEKQFALGQAWAFDTVISELQFRLGNPADDESEVARD